MIKIENVVTPSPEQWKATIMGTRNAMNSWEKSDSKVINTTLKRHDKAPGVIALEYEPVAPYISIGENDHALMMKLANAGPVHGKFRRMITVYVDITAPLYW